MRSPLLSYALLMHMSLLPAYAAAGASPAAGAGPAGAARSKSAMADSAVAVPARATFAGGCFWCMETAFEGLPGVKSVISGYTGGPERNPSYEQVSSKTTGHSEAVQITYDPRQISYAQLLDLFWHNVDPTDAGGQFCDRGPEYRSEIYYHDATQKRLAEESKRKIETAPEFWPAEEYHQDFYKKSPVRYHGYRAGCGRDRRLTDLWGKPGRQGEAK